MWIRKTQNEIAEKPTRSWLALGEPMLLWLIVFVTAFFLGAVDAPPRHVQMIRHPQLTWSEVFYRAVGVALIATFIACIYKSIVGRSLFQLSPSPKTQICNTCYRVKSPDGQLACDCGGIFEDFELWKWVDD
jgi:hypothetical protein